jgi:hypothetical protein
MGKGMSNRNDVGVGRVAAQTWINRGKANTNTTALAAARAVYTVVGLPAGVVGDTAIVSDATTPTYLGTLTGGGAVVCPVFHNGTAWVST